MTTVENEILNPNDTDLKVGETYKYTLKVPQGGDYQLRVMDESDFSADTGSLASVKHLSLAAAEREGQIYLVGSFTVPPEWAGATIRIGFMAKDSGTGHGGQHAYTVVR